MVLLKQQLIELMNKNTTTHIIMKNTIIFNKVSTEFNDKIKLFPTNDIGTKIYPYREA